MNPDSPKTPREEMELRITALLLGELSADEAAAVRELISHDRELTALHDRLKQAITLVREAAISADQPASEQAAPLKLSDERREKLLAHFKTVAPKEFVPEKRRTKFTLLELAAVIAILGLLAAISIPNFVRSRTTSQSNAIMNNLRQIDAAKQQWALEKNKSAMDVPTLGELKPYLGRARGELPPSVSGETYVVGRVTDPVTAEMNAAPARNWFSWLSGSQRSGDASDQRVQLSSDGRVTLGGKHQPAAVTMIPTAPVPSTVSESSQGVSATLSADQSATLTPATAGFDQRLSRIVRRAAASGESDKVTETSRPATPPAQIVLPSTTLADADAESSGAKVLADNSSLGIAGRPIANVNSSAFSSGTVPSKNGDHLYFATQQSEPSLNTDPTTGLPAGTVVADSFTPLTTAPATEPPAQRFGGGGGFGGGGAGGGGGGIGGRGEVAGVRYNFVTNSVALANNSARNSDELANYQVHAGFDTASFGVSSGRLSVTENAGVPPDANGNKVPILGNIPVEGRLFRSAQPSSATTSPGFSLLGPAELPKLNDDALATSGANTFVGGAVVNNGTLTLGENRSKADGFNLNVAGIAEDQAVKVRDLAEQHSNHGNPQDALAALQKTFDIKPDSKTVAMAVGGESLRRARSPIVLPSKAPDADRSAVELTMANPTIELGRSPARTLRLPGSQSVAATPPRVQAGKPVTELADVQKRDIEKAESNRPYFEAKQRLEELQNFRSVLSQKIASEEGDLKLPKETMVEVIDRAEPSSAPSQTLWGKLTGKFDGVARINVQKEGTDISSLGTLNYNQGAVDPYFVQTEYEIIRSAGVLGKAVDALRLDEAWGKNKGGKLTKEEAIALLKRRIEINPMRNTSVLEIRAKGDKPEEAVQIANAVADAYRDYRLERNRGQMEQGIAALKEEVNKQDKEIRLAQARLNELRVGLNISDVDTAGGVPVIERDAAPVRKPSTNAPIPQPEIQTSENNFSTFSLNVSDVSFKLAAASLEKGQMPDPASIRSEEFINAFDYRDPEATAGSPIAFAYECARYPFAHNRDLLRFSLKTAAAGRQAGRPLNIVLLLDNSGSMERADRVQIIHEALRVLASQLQPQDKLSVITFARTARLFADGVSGDKAGEIAEQVSGLTPEGGTNLEDAMNLAYQTAAKHYLANGINRVVLLTDGAANLGDVEPDSLKQKVEAQRKQGIALDCFGIGWEGFNDDLLEVLSRNGDGRYGFINSPEEAATDFVGQLAGALKVAASDVKVQVEFNPKRVASYRQIGYAKHQLTKEQFRDNTVDAAEIAAQEAGNALYTVEVNPAGSGPLCTMRVRYKVPGTSDYREQAWDVPYSGNALSLEQSSPAMRLAASASAFSEWLAVSPFAGEVTPDRVLGCLSGVPEIYGADARPNKLEWMIRQAKAISGQ